MINLKQCEGIPQTGLATISDEIEEWVAEFCLKGRETYIKLHVPSEKPAQLGSIRFLPVRMVDGRCFTFLDNVTSNIIASHGGYGSVATFLPSFVFLGQSFVDEDYKLDSISFSVDDAESIFYDFDAFSTAIDPTPEIEAIIAKNAAVIGKPIEVGKDPIVAYFTGKRDILSTATSLGNVSVEHNPSYSTGGPTGVSIDNRIAISIDFEQPVQVEGAIELLMPLLRFLQLIAGRKQRISKLAVKLNGTDEAAWHDLVWCLSWSGKADGPSPNPGDLPINGGEDSTEFSKVLGAWLSVDDERRDARVRFAEAFSQQRQYSIERLVSAANMFDILPSNCYAPKIDFPSDVAKAQKEARELFKVLPPSDLRDRALGDLGRLGQLNLKAKVQQRAGKLLAVDPEKYFELNQVLRDAVDARNHYVHGTPMSAEKSSFFRRVLPFHIGALEFVFATSDLVDSGWNYKAWANRGTTMSHPFGEFLASYKSRVVSYMSERDSLPNAKLD